MEGVATWDGVKNPVAMKHLRAMQPGDEVLIYHTGNEKSVIGVAQVVAAGDPPQLKVTRRLARAVTLAEVKQDADLRRIPVVIMTSSDDEKDILAAYSLYVNCYVTKPVDLDQFIGVVKSIESFWFNIVKLPAA